MNDGNKKARLGPMAKEPAQPSDPAGGVADFMRLVVEQPETLARMFRNMRAMFEPPWRARTLFGLNAEHPSRPGQQQIVRTVNRSPNLLRYERLLIPEPFRSTVPFDVLSFVIDGTEQIHGPVAASLFEGEKLMGDPIPPGGTVDLVVLLRSRPQTEVYFQAALVVEVIELEAEGEQPAEEPAPGPGSVVPPQAAVT